MVHGPKQAPTDASRPLAADTGPRELSESHSLSESEFTGHFPSRFLSKGEKQKPSFPWGSVWHRSCRFTVPAPKGPLPGLGLLHGEGFRDGRPPYLGCLGKWGGVTPEQGKPKTAPLVLAPGGDV